MFEILKRGKHILIAVGVCCCLQTSISVVNMLVLGPSLMVISITGILLYYLPLLASEASLHNRTMRD